MAARGIPPEAEDLPAGQVEKVAISYVTPDSKQAAEDIIVREFPLTIMLNDLELVTLLCSPADLKYLALVFFSPKAYSRPKKT